MWRQVQRVPKTGQADPKTTKTAKTAADRSKMYSRQAKTMQDTSKTWPRHVQDVFKTIQGGGTCPMQAKTAQEKSKVVQDRA